MSESTVRCPNCGKRLSPGTRVCPACGANQPLHIRRIRCNYCRLRIPADAQLCPNCQHDPRGYYLRPRAILGSIGLLALAGLIYFALNPSLWANALKPLDTATPLATQTETVVSALVITATLPPSATPSATELPTSTVLPTATPTVTPSEPATPTATKRVITILPSPTAIPTSTVYPAPYLAGPASGATLSGRKQQIILTFGSDLGLQANEWFRIEVIFKSRTNSFANWCGWTKGNSIRFPASYYDESWQPDRTFRWHVTIAQAAAALPSTCAAVSTDVSAPSDEWIFYWY